MKIKAVPPNLANITAGKKNINCTHLSLNSCAPKVFFVCLFWFFGFCFFFFLLFKAALAAYGSFQAQGQIGAAAASLCHSHSNTRSEPHLQPMPWLTRFLTY